VPYVDTSLHRKTWGHPVSDFSAAGSKLSELLQDAKLQKQQSSKNRHYVSDCCKQKQVCWQMIGN